MKTSISILTALVLVGAMLAAPVGAQSADTIVLQVDRPAAGEQLRMTGWFGGWAIDQSVTASPGISQLAVYMDGDATNGRFLGLAQLGGSRPDVATQFGNPNYALAGWNFSLTRLGITGQHSFTFVATGSQGALSARSVDTVTLQAPPPPYGYAPEPPFVPYYGYGYGYGSPWAYGSGYGYPWGNDYGYGYPWNYGSGYPWSGSYVYPWYYYTPPQPTQPASTPLPQTGGTNLWSGSGGTPNVPPVNLPQYSTPTSP